MINALSIDFEEWYHPELVKNYLGDIPRSNRAGKVVKMLLSLLDQYSHKATFFLLSDTVKAYPGLIREIVERGHEIGFHGHTHKTLYEHSPESFQGEIQSFLKTLFDAGIDFKPKGYRAPTFSLKQSTSWALNILKNNGFLYDSSIFPFSTRLYGVKGAPLRIYRPDPEDIIREQSSGLLEFPLSMADIWSWRIPVSGGIYFRLLPLSLSRMLLKSINAEGRPFVFYFHPWEMDPGIPRLQIGKVNSLLTYGGVKSMAAKIERILQDFNFGRLDKILGVSNE